MTPRARRGRGDRGAAVVEFVLVAPLLFLSMLVLADFALAELSDAVGANAAREGARAGILHYDGAHTPGSTNNTKVKDAVTETLGGNVKGTPTVTVRCLEANGTARVSGGSCSTVGTDEVEVGEDLIEVTVSWERKGGITGYIGGTSRTDKAVMRIVGTPPAGAPAPPECTIDSAVASPGTVVRTGSSIPDITFTVTVSDATVCGTPLLELPAQSGYGSAQSMVATATVGEYSFTMTGSTGSWTAGTKTATVSANGGSVTGDVTFVVNDPTVCLITGASASPNAVTQSGGTLSSAITFSVTVSDATACGTPTLTFPANAGYTSPRPMTSAGGNSFSFVLPVGQGTWTSQTYQVVANASTAPAQSISFVVSNTPTCTLTNLSITPATAFAKNNGQRNIESTITIRVTRSSLSVCAVPTVTVTPGKSGNGANDLTTARSMRNVGTTATCTNLTCEWVIANGERDWGPASSDTRTVTVTASGSTVTGTLTITPH